MEGADELEWKKWKAVEKRNGFALKKLIQEHITILDLSNKNIEAIDENVKLPIHLTELILSNNKLSEVPVAVVNLENLKILDLSHNCIKYFDDTPNFCHTIQSLSLSNNDLHGPPYWIWSEKPTNLAEINLSCNVNITKSFHDGYYEELLQYKTLVTNIIMYNCKLIDHMELISTFPNAKSLVLGTNDYSYYSVNQLEEVPCSGIDKCCDIEYLNLSNTNIYTVNSSIQIYRQIKEINLSHNKLNSLPEEFCLLENLEICILSYNRLYSLPANFCNLSKITNLSAECNELYILPCDICKLPNIRRLDVYDNYIDKVPDGIEHLLEVDLAQNYFEEPNDVEYLEKRKTIRATNEYRWDGRKEEESSESEHSKVATDDELFLTSTKDKVSEVEVRSSSPEDWDSDDYWIPHISRHSNQSGAIKSPWLYFIKKKIEEGNFCPIDAHPIPIADQIRYARMCNPKIEYESDGQFDDFSGDDS